MEEQMMTEPSYGYLCKQASTSQSISQGVFPKPNPQPSVEPLVPNDTVTTVCEKVQQTCHSPKGHPNTSLAHSLCTKQISSSRIEEQLNSTGAVHADAPGLILLSSICTKEAGMLSVPEISTITSSSSTTMEEEDMDSSSFSLTSSTMPIESELTDLLSSILNNVSQAEEAMQSSNMNNNNNSLLMNGNTLPLDIQPNEGQSAQLAEEDQTSQMEAEIGNLTETGITDSQLEVETAQLSDDLGNLETLNSFNNSNSLYHVKNYSNQVSESTVSLDLERSTAMLVTSNQCNSVGIVSAKGHDQSDEALKECTHVCHSSPLTTQESVPNILEQSVPLQNVSMETTDTITSSSIQNHFNKNIFSVS